MVALKLEQKFYTAVASWPILPYRPSISYSVPAATPVCITAAVMICTTLFIT